MEGLNGLWTVVFKSNFQTIGTGVVVFANGRILGGDSYYYYEGNAKAEGNVLEANIRVVRFNKAGMAIFGNLDSFNLRVSGEISQSDIELRGTMVEQTNMKITITGKKIADV